MKYIFIIVCLLFALLNKAEERNAYLLDSLNSVIKNTKQDTSICAAYSMMGKLLIAQNPVKAKKVLEENIMRCKNLLKKETAYKSQNRINYHLGNSLNNLGSILKNNGDLNTALDKYNEAFVVFKKMNLLYAIANSYNNIGTIYFYYNDYVRTIEYFEKALKIRIELKDSLGISSSYTNLGIVNGDMDKALEAIEYINKALNISRQLKDKDGMARSLNSLGITLSDLGNISAAIDCYFQSLKLKEEINDKTGIASTCINLGRLYSNLGNSNKAIDYQRKGLTYCLELRDSNKAAIAYTSLGYSFSQTNKKDSALLYYKKSFEIYKRGNNKSGMAGNLNNIGLLFNASNQHDSAMYYFMLAQSYYSDADNKQGVSMSLNNIGNEFICKKDFKKAIEYCLKSYRLSKAIGYPKDMKDAAQNLSICYKAINDFDNSLMYLKVFVMLRDSIMNDELTRQSIQRAYQYDYNKKLMADSILQIEKNRIHAAEMNQNRAEIDAKKAVKGFLIFGLLLVIGIIFFVYSRYKLSLKQREIIQTQKETVAAAFIKLKEKNKEVMDSIKYAARIQRSLITSEHYVKKYLNRVK